MTRKEDYLWKYEFSSNFIWKLVDMVIGPIKTITLSEEEIGESTWKTISHDIRSLLSSLSDLDCPYANQDRLANFNRNQEISRRYSRLLFQLPPQNLDSHQLSYLSGYVKDVLFIYSLFYYFSMLNLRQSWRLYRHHDKNSMLYEKKISKKQLEGYEQTIDFIIRETYKSQWSKYDPLMVLNWNLGYSDKPIVHRYIDKVILNTPYPNQELITLGHVLEIIEGCVNTSNEIEKNKE